LSIILAIDTSFGTSVALVENGQVRAEVNVLDTMRHAERIGEAIEQVLATSDVRPSQIGEVVVGRGPAPFTGLRVGIAAAVMFAEGAGAKLFGAVSLDAIARSEFENLELRGQVSAARPLLVTSDARRGEVYWALYEGLSKAGSPLRIEGPAVIKPAALEELLTERGIEPLRASAPVTAASLGLLADALLIDGLLETDVTALYLRDPDATVPNPKQRVGKAVSS
jgi:tRNA threonylcarbamoyl adenosine modification protein YeaZ